MQIPCERGRQAMQFTRREKGIWIDKDPDIQNSGAPQYSIMYCAGERSAAKLDLDPFTFSLVWFTEHISYSPTVSVDMSMQKCRLVLSVLNVNIGLYTQINNAKERFDHNPNIYGGLDTGFFSTGFQLNLSLSKISASLGLIRWNCENNRLSSVIVIQFQPPFSLVLLIFL
jgi:hypothetical protein